MVTNPFVALALALSGVLLGTASVASWRTRGAAFWARAELRLLRAYRHVPQLPIRHARAR